MKSLYSSLCGLGISLLIGVIIWVVLYDPDYVIFGALAVTIVGFPFWYLIVRFISSKSHKTLCGKKVIYMCLCTLGTFYAFIVGALLTLQNREMPIRMICAIIWTISFGLEMFIYAFMEPKEFKGKIISNKDNESQKVHKCTISDENNKEAYIKELIRHVQNDPYGSNHDFEE